MTNGDELLEIDLECGHARAMICDTTILTQYCSDIHNCSPVCTAALGRLMTGTLMLGVMMKGKDESVTVSIRGGGPMGHILAVANHGDVKSYAEKTDVQLPLRSDGKLDVGRAVGKAGRISVAKALGMKKDYIGQTELVSGEIAEDFANYFVMSEQKPSLVALGVLINKDTVLRAGGLLIQPLPDCDNDVIDQLELRSPMFADISRELAFASPEQLCNDWFNGLRPRILSRVPLRYHCDCSRSRIEKALLSIGRKELQSLVDEGKDTTVSCHFCMTQYQFNVEELDEMLRKSLL